MDYSQLEQQIADHINNLDNLNQEQLIQLLSAVSIITAATNLKLNYLTGIFAQINKKLAENGVQNDEK